MAELTAHTPSAYHARMVYRITVRSNPRILLMLFIIIGLPTAGVVSFFLLSPFVGIIVTVLGVYLAYQLTKFLARSLRSSVETNDDGIRFRLGYKDNPQMDWEDITIAGSYIEGKSRPHLFVYNEDTDNLITIPPDYENYEGLVEEVRSHVEIEEIELEETQTVADYLKERLGLGDEADQDEDGDEAETGADVPAETGDDEDPEEPD